MLISVPQVQLFYILIRVFFALVPLIWANRFFPVTKIHYLASKCKNAKYNHLLVNVQIFLHVLFLFLIVKSSLRHKYLEAFRNEKRNYVKC